MYKYITPWFLCIGISFGYLGNEAYKEMDFKKAISISVIAPIIAGICIGDYLRGDR